MSKCSAGDCDVVCGGTKGCGCIASSDDPLACDCWCFGDAPGSDKGLKFKPSELVDIQISGLPLLEVAKILNSVGSERVLVPVDTMNKRVHLKLKRKRFARVLKDLGLATSRRQRKTRQTATQR
jgi:hypothetical protein